MLHLRRWARLLYSSPKPQNGFSRNVAGLLIKSPDAGEVWAIGNPPTIAAAAEGYKNWLL